LQWASLDITVSERVSVGISLEVMVFKRDCSGYTRVLKMPGEILHVHVGKARREGTRKDLGRFLKVFAREGGGNEGFPTNRFEKFAEELQQICLSVLKEKGNTRES
jgi:hypothetical protein